MDGRPTWTDCEEAGDYVVPNVLSPRDLVSRPDIMDETVPHVSIEGQGHFLTLAQGRVHTKMETGFSQKLLCRCEPNVV